MLGTVSQIRRYPVKSMAGEVLERATVTPHGLAGDRGYALFDPAERQVVSASKVVAFPRLLDFRATYSAEREGSGSLPPIAITFPDGSSVRSDDPSCRDRLSAWFGRPVGFGAVTDADAERPAPPKFALAGTFQDHAALHIITNVAMATLAASTPGSDIAIDRFRPNLVVGSSAATGYPENEWTGRRLRIGEQVVIEVTDGCPRCVMATMAQGELDRDPEVLKSIARQNMRHTAFMESMQPCLGAYAFVVQGGVVSAGDTIRLE